MNILVLMAELAKIAIKNPNIKVFGNFVSENDAIFVNLVKDDEDEYVWIH